MHNQIGIDTIQLIYEIFHERQLRSLPSLHIGSNLKIFIFNQKGEPLQLLSYSCRCQIVVFIIYKTQRNGLLKILQFYLRIENQINQHLMFYLAQQNKQFQQILSSLQSKNTLFSAIEFEYFKKYENSSVNKQQSFFDFFNYEVWYGKHEKSRKQVKQYQFLFDYAFWSHDGYIENQSGQLVPVDTKYASQQCIFKEVGEDLMVNALQGFNCCLFAYGQTGAGKSYTMLGYGPNKGIVPLATQYIFEKVKRDTIKNRKEFQISLSMLEIYNQKVQDLFVNPNKRPVAGLKIRQNKTLGVYVEGLSKIPVKSSKQMEKRMDEGSRHRSMASTLMNQYSSRAHTIIIIQILQKNTVSPTKMNKKVSKINLVDLAGSQRVSKSGVQSKDRLKQASQINKSLSTLGRVIEILSQHTLGKNKTIQPPYRQSALTRILENALSGNSKTTMICTISPASDNFQQSLSTLRYAEQARKIKNKPEVNQTSVDKLIAQLKAQNQRLQKMIAKKEDSRDTTMLSTDEIQNNAAQIKEVQRQIRHTMQSFAMNTDQLEQNLDQLMINPQPIEFENTQFLSSELSFDFDNIQNCQAYITNLNQDQILNFKVKHSCDPQLIVGSRKDYQFGRFVLCGLGIEQNHVKISKDERKQYYIEPLTEQAAQYTFLNGEPVIFGFKNQLYHNDRIILGINCVFLFKHSNKIARPSVPQQKKITHQYALNQRQQNYMDVSLSFGNTSRMDDREALEITSKLTQIQKQFELLLLQNEKKMKEKEQQYKLKLQIMEAEKEKERLAWQGQFKKKQQQTLRLKKEKQETQKLKQQLLEEKSKEMMKKKPKMGLNRYSSLNMNYQFEIPKGYIKGDNVQTIIENDIHHHHHHHHFHEKVGPESQSSLTKLIHHRSDNVNKSMAVQPIQQHIFQANQWQSYINYESFRNRSDDQSSKKRSSNEDNLLLVEQEFEETQKLYKGKKGTFNKDKTRKGSQTKFDAPIEIDNKQSILLDLSPQDKKLETLGRSQSQQNILISQCAQQEENINNKQQIIQKQIVKKQQETPLLQEPDKEDPIIDKNQQLIQNLDPTMLVVSQEQAKTNPQMLNPRESYLTAPLSLSSDQGQIRQQLGPIKFGKRVSEEVDITKYELKQQELNRKIKELQEKLAQVEKSKIQMEKNKQQMEKIKQQQIQQQAKSELLNPDTKNKQTGAFEIQTEQLPKQQKKVMKEAAINWQNDEVQEVQQIAVPHKQSQDLNEIIKMSMIQCNNQNILNQRNLNLRKCKQQIEELRKVMIRKQKIQLQKQLITLIPMIQKFNRLAKNMNRLIEVSVDIQYKKYNYEELLQAVRRDTYKSKINIKILVVNLEEGRKYHWPLNVFKNRYELVLEAFQRYIQQPNSIIFQEKSLDPFWQPIELQSIAFAFLSLEPLLYQISYEGQISLITKGKIVGKLQVSIKPLNKYKPQDLSIFNPRSLLNKPISFQLRIGQLKMLDKSFINFSTFNISYEFFEDDYQSVICQTQEHKLQEDPNLDYIQQHTISKLTDYSLNCIYNSQLCFRLNVIEKIDEQMAKRIKQESFLSKSAQINISQFNKEVLDISGKKTMSKKQSPTIFENTEILQKINKQYQNQKEDDKKKNEAKKKQLDSKKKKSEDCIIF